MGLAEGLMDSGRKMLGIFASILRTRLSLLGVEVREEQQRIFLLLVLAAASLLFFAMGLIMASFLVVVAFWDTDYRLLAIACLGGVYWIVALLIALWLRARARIEPVLFAASLAELTKDEAELAPFARDYSSQDVQPRSG